MHSTPMEIVFKDIHLKRIRMCHPKICLFGERIILSRRSHRKNSLPCPFLAKAGYKFPFVKIPPPPAPSHSRKKSGLLALGTALTRVCINIPYKNNLYLPLVLSIYLPSYNLPPLLAQTPLPLSCHFSTLYHLLLKWYISPQT